MSDAVTLATTTHLDNIKTAGVFTCPAYLYLWSPHCDHLLFKKYYVIFKIHKKV